MSLKPRLQEYFDKMPRGKWLTVDKLCAALDLSVTGVRTNMEKLIAAGEVEFRQAGKFSEYRVATNAAKKGLDDDDRFLVDMMYAEQLRLKELKRELQAQISQVNKDIKRLSIAQIAQKVEKSVGIVNFHINKNLAER